MQIQYANSLADVTPEEWNRLAGDENPFTQYAFLSALEQHECLQPYGWQPVHILVRDAHHILVAALPLYVKGNSYGEFVFDWSWASAYERLLGKDYYPKLVCAIPYTPATGPRLLIDANADRALLATVLHQAAQHLAQEHHMSSLHYLFTHAQDSAFLFEKQGLLARVGYQFHWDNQGYRDFVDYLDSFVSKKRKQIRRERRDAAQCGVTIEILDGHQATDEHWAIFHDFYCSTFDRKSGVPTLSLDFFRALAKTMPDAVVLVMAHDNGRYVAGAFNLRGKHTLYGRHWGCNTHFRHLHFEMCYYQTLDYCIANGLHRFEAGAQGEHKLSRGFLPQLTWSAHWLADAQFSQIVQRSLEQETQVIKIYIDELLEEHSPFKQLES